MTQNPPDMKIRLSADLRRQVEAAAKQNNRTLNSEIVSRLEASFRSPAAPMDDTPARHADLSRLSEKVEWLEQRLLVLEKREK
ncbi:Arc family DNA-binding protein [Rhizobium sp. AG855]|uniref:Arc family DNA-binding protein n=1 Tax=Rhizobium sp. AG855 TaxID=2183898 RepID=UPI000E72B803|nr:Arc family DNA-binding protein [Rhizobium sp. AG855]